MTSNLLPRFIVILVVMALAVACITLNWPINLGIDLKGGSILTYKVEKLDSGAPGDQVDPVTGEAVQSGELEETITVISQRINSEGLKDISVRQEGEDMISIYLANFTKEQADEIRRRMTQVGELLFPIVAQAGDVGPEDPNRDGAKARFNQSTLDAERRAAAAEGRPYIPPAGFRFYPERPQREDKETEAQYEERLKAYREQLATDPASVPGQWMYFDPQFWNADLGGGFSGQSIKEARKSYDEQGGRAVAYNVKESYQVDFADYTRQYTGRNIALVLNGEVWSTATIQGTLSDSVLINKAGGGYTETEQTWLLNCLQSGSLKLKPRLLSQDEISATLGEHAIESGIWAFIVGMVLVVLVMVGVYRLSGIFAVVALGVNFLLIFGVLMLLEASLTLPGIAGLVLTVGMAVDANILIFERIREEIEKGKSVVQAAKNGFDRAFVTIFDANLTTFIVAAFLVYEGTGPIKGFGYTLMTGIVCTMFAALYFTRTAMGWAIKIGMIKDVVYRPVLQHVKVNFGPLFKPAMIGSLIVIALGMAAFFGTGRDKYGLDFTGGTSVRMMFAQDVAEKDIVEAVKAIEGQEGQPRYDKIEATMITPAADEAAQGIKTVAKLYLDYKPVEGAAAVSGGDGEDEYEAIQRGLARAFEGLLIPPTTSDLLYDAASGSWSTRINLAQPAPNARAAIEEAARKAGINDPVVEAVADSGDRAWRLSGRVTPVVSGTVKNLLLEELRDTDLLLSNPFPEVRFVGPKVVADLTSSALSAIVLSLIFILAYIWFRFRELKYGFAAAVALVHDVLVALGVTVAANASGIIHVPITLNMIAAFLTIIGYSLNDTIVVFDRIRENLGNVKGSFGEVVQRSINQTLSRTVLTSVTTAVVVAAVFFFNIGIESPLEGFAFALLIGVIVGTYSSMFVASPLLIWMHDRENKKKEEARSSRPATATS